MEVTPATPDTGQEPAPTDTPPAAAPAAQPGEPVATPDAPPPADQSAAATPSFTQAEYTQSQQTIAAIRAELGLDRSTPRAKVLEAFKEKLALAAKAEAATPDDGEEPDPRLAEAEARAFRAEIRAQSAIFGEDFTLDAVEVINLARTENDPEKLILALAAFRDRHATTAQAPAAAPAAAPSTPTPPADAGLPEGDVPSARPTAPAGRRESGVVGAVRGLFKQASEQPAGRT